MDVVIAGLLAGIGVAMPLGAIGVLLVNEGITAGWWPAAAGGTGVALVDVGYAVVAVALGSRLSHALSGWERAIHIAGAVLLVAIAVRGLSSLTRVRAVAHRHARRVGTQLPALEPGPEPEPPAASPRTPPGALPAALPGALPGAPPETPTGASPGRVLARFVGLTAVNPLTAVYFVALAAGLGHTLDGWSAALAFVLAVFAASWAWQLLLAAFGAIAGARLPPAARQVTGMAGYLVVLGYAAQLALS